MAKAKKKHRKSRTPSVSLAVVGGFAPGVGKLWYHFRNPSLHGAGNGFEAAGIEASRIYAGYDPRDGSFNMAWMGLGTFPILIGALVHKFVGGRLGVNRMLGASGIPFIRL